MNVDFLSTLCWNEQCTLTRLRVSTGPVDQKSRVWADRHRQTHITCWTHTHTRSNSDYKLYNLLKTLTNTSFTRWTIRESNETGDNKWCPRRHLRRVLFCEFISVMCNWKWWTLIENYTTETLTHSLGVWQAEIEPVSTCENYLERFLENPSFNTVQPSLILYKIFFWNNIFLYSYLFICIFSFIFTFRHLLDVLIQSNLKLEWKP